jgi:hypothetical protein
LGWPSSFVELEAVAATQAVCAMQFDFFLAHASADKREAEKLSWELEDLERSVFLDSADIRAGDVWDERLISAFSDSKVIIVLVSKHTAQAFYQREEIARAIKRMRKDPNRARIAVVMLPGAVEADVPYGLSIVQAINASKSGGLQRAARDLDEQFPADRKEAAEFRRNAYYALGAALRLDRVKQWSQVLEATHIPENAFFLLHGPHDQNVGLFLERIQRFFSQELAIAHKIYRVPFNIQGQTPRTGTDWLAHLRDGLRCTGAIAPRLRQLAQQQPLFIMLGQSPLPLDRLTDQHISALGEFMTTHLVSLIRESRISRGICFMLAIDYEHAIPDSLNKLKEWGGQAEASHTLRFRILPQATLPTWDEVNDYLLNNVAPPPTPEQIEMIHREYDRHASNPDLTFERLARLIDRYTLAG